MLHLADQLEAELRPLGTAERAAQEKRYLKSDLEHLGVTCPPGTSSVSWWRTRRRLDVVARDAFPRAAWRGNAQKTMVRCKKNH